MLVFSSSAEESLATGRCGFVVLVEGSGLSIFLLYYLDTPFFENVYLKNILIKIMLIPRTYRH